ncbi:Ankyrin repeat-containing domain protein [Lactarius tabidus]
MLLWEARDGTGGARPWCPIKCGEHPGRDTIASGLLIGHGANVDARDKGRMTPLHSACYYGKLQIVRALLSHGASVNMMGVLGQTALHLVLEGNRSGPDGVRITWTRKTATRRHHYIWHATMGILRLDGCYLYMVQILTQKTSMAGPLCICCHYGHTLKTSLVL